MKNAVLSLSGGMDSSTLLLHLLANGYKVTALSFDYGQKHRVELERAQQLVNYINDMGARNNNIPEQIAGCDVNLVSFVMYPAKLGPLWLYVLYPYTCILSSIKLNKGIGLTITISVSKYRKISVEL